MCILDRFFDIERSLDQIYKLNDFLPKLDTFINGSMVLVSDWGIISRLRLCHLVLQ